MDTPSKCRIANIDPNHAMILPHDATPKPDRIFGRDRRQTPSMFCVIAAEWS